MLNLATILLLLGLLGGQAEGQSRYTLKQWQSPAECPDQDHFRSQLDEALGETPATLPPLVLSIHIENQGGGVYHLTLRTHDGEDEGLWELDAPDCDELTATAAVILSLALQPTLLYNNESKHEVVVVPFVQQQATDEEDPDSHRQDLAQSITKDRRSNSDLQLAVRVATTLDIGTLPKPALGLAVVASAHSGPYRLAFRLTQWAQQRRYVTSFNPNRGGQFDYLSGTLDLCGELWSISQIQSGACGVVNLGRLNARSIEIDIPIDQAHIMAGLGVGVFAQIATSKHSSLRLQLELSAQLVRPRYTAEVVDEHDDSKTVMVAIHQPDLLARLLSASWGLQF